MTDSEVVRRIEERVGRSVPHTLRDGVCTRLSLTSDDSLYHGLIRHHSASAKREVLGLLCRLTGLRSLNLRRNRLGELPSELKRLSELEELVLGSNYLGRVPPAIQGFRRLRVLHLGNNDLTELPDWLGELRDLEYLALHKNVRLRSLEALRGLPRIRNLNLFLLNLVELPEVVYEFEELTTLTLWNVSRYPAGLDVLSNLEFFTVSGSRLLRTVPPGLTRLSKLRMTRLHQNSIERLPEDMGALNRLEQLTVYQNELSHLPASMRELARLEKLNLGWNHFSRIPGWVWELPALQWLGVFDNPLSAPVEPPEHREIEVVAERPFSTPPPR